MYIWFKRNREKEFLNNDNHSNNNKNDYRNSSNNINKNTKFLKMKNEEKVLE